MRVFLPLLLVSALLFPFLLSPTTAAARCAPSGLEAYLMNDADTPLAADGALIVGLRPSRARARTRPQGFPELSLNQGDTRIPLRLEVLAGFVARYVPETTPAPGRYRVAGLDGVRVRFEARTAAAPLPAPAVRAVQRRRLPQRRAVREQVRVVLSERAPSRSVAALVESERGGFGGGVIAEDRGGLSAYDWGARCQQRPRGLRALPPVGAEVTVRFIDQDGQLGAPTTISMTAG